MLRCFLLLLVSFSLVASGFPGVFPGEYGQRVSAQTKSNRQGAKAKATPESPKLGEYKSANFVLRTDLTAEESKELLDRLETMLVLISRYWGKRNSQIIEMYVVKDLSNWPEGLLSPEGRASIASGGGVTATVKRTIGTAWQAKSIVYAIADRGTPQHEVVHAYCAQAFGSVGPTWYAEGMAEVGQYWRDIDDKTVRCDEHVIRYLKSGDPKSLKDMVDLAQFTGDSWQNYAWRWSLCHLLGFNENYTARFKPLGLALMSEQPGVTFWTVYGSMAEEIEFEHRLFIKNMEPGYRVDLCSWDWKTKFQQLRGSRTVVSKISANRGWQASRLEVKPGETYQYEMEGTWSIGAEGENLTADGQDNGTGRLIGVIFHDYELSEPFDLGAKGEFTAEQKGKLYVRCNDNWSQLDDNSGTLTLKLKLAK